MSLFLGLASRTFAFFAIGQFLCPLSHAQTLTEALAQAFERDPMIKSDRLLVNELEIRSEAAAAVRGVKVTLNQDNTFANAIANSDQQNDFASSGVSVRAEKLIFDHGSNEALVQSIDRAGLAQKHRLAHQLNLRLTDFAQLYIDLVLQQEIVSVRLNSLRALEQQVEGAKLRFRLGRGTKTDIAFAESRYATTKAELISAELRSKFLVERYVEVFGYVPTFYSLEYDLEGWRLPETLDSATYSATVASPLALASSEDVRSAELELYSTKKNQGMKVTASSEMFSRRTESLGASLFDDQDSSGVQAGVSIRIPIFTSGQRSSDIRISMNQVSRAEIQKTSVLRTLRTQVASDWYGYQAALERLGFAEVALEASQLALIGTKKENEAGRRSALEVLDAEREYLNARLGQINAERELVASKLALALSTGRTSYFFGLTIDKS